MRVVLFTLVSLVAGLTTFGQSEKSQSQTPLVIEITLSRGGTIQYDTHYIYRIDASGSVTREYSQGGLPRLSNFSLELIVKSSKPAPPPPAKKAGLSNEELQSLAKEFEAQGFFEMDDRYYGDPTTGETACTNHAEAKGLSISLDGKKKSVSFFLGCSYAEASPFNRFVTLYNAVYKAISGVEVKTIDPPKAVN